MSDEGVYGKAFAKVDVTESWHEGIDFLKGLQPNRVATDTVFDVAKSNMLEQATKGLTPPTYFGSANGRFLAGSQEKLLAFIESIGAEPVARYVAGGHMLSTAYVWKNGCIHLIPFVDDDGAAVSQDPDELDFDDDDGDYVDPIAVTDEEFNFSYVSTDRTIIDQLIGFIKTNQAPFRQRIVRERGRAYMLADVPRMGLQLVSLGIAGEDLIEDNYEPEVMVGYKRIIEDFTAEVPRGRLAILEGAPGCGKTHMTQAIMKACGRSKFVIIPPKMLKDLEDPGFILTFLQQNSESNGEPLILVLEDADQCLAARTAENISSISAVLNLSDGIVGKLLNLRILATTNTPIETIQNGKTVKMLDSAALRKGRLSAHVKVGPIPKKQALRVFARLTTADAKPSVGFNDWMSLGDVYDAAGEWIENNPTAITVEDLKNLK